MKRAIAILTMLCLVGVMTVGCAANDATLRGAYVSKQSAEAIYKTLYKEYERGNVSTEDIETAAFYYDVWFDAQVSLHNALALGDGATADQKALIINEMVVSLLDLAIRLGVL